jgi:hypothetical protein
MKRSTIVGAMTIFGLVSAAHAAMPDLRNLTCSHARQLVRSKQSVALANRKTWDTYVSDDGQCAAGMKTVPAFVIAKDTHGVPLCHIVSRCAGGDGNTYDGGP